MALFLIQFVSYILNNGFKNDFKLASISMKKQIILNPSTFNMCIYINSIYM